MKNEYTILKIVVQYPLMAGPRIHSNSISLSIMYLEGVVAARRVPVNMVVFRFPAKMKQFEAA